VRVFRKPSDVPFLSLHHVAAKRVRSMRARFKLWASNGVAGKVGNGRCLELSFFSRVALHRFTRSAMRVPALVFSDGVRGRIPTGSLSVVTHHHATKSSAAASIHASMANGTDCRCNDFLRKENVT